MASLERVEEKLGRARYHIDELRDALLEYYEKSPPNIVPLPSRPGTQGFRFVVKDEPPVSISLIFGDALQNIRSALDYLIWELVLAEGKNKPNSKNMFPIALTDGAYKDDLVKRHRLDGIGDAAKSHIDAFQPYKQADPHKEILAVLDALTNINKHRRVLVVRMAANLIKRPFSYPHVAAKVNGFDSEDKIVLDETIFIFAALKDSPVCGDMEVTVLLNTLADFVGNQMLPIFEQFFK